MPIFVFCVEPNTIMSWLFSPGDVIQDEKSVAKKDKTGECHVQFSSHVLRSVIALSL